MKSEEQLLKEAEPQIAALGSAMTCFTEFACLRHPELLERFEATFTKGWGTNLSPKEFVQFITSLIREYPDVGDSDPYETLVTAWDALREALVDGKT